MVDSIKISKPESSLLSELNSTSLQVGKIKSNTTEIMENTKQIEGFLTYNNSQYEFVMQYPPSWEIMPSNSFTYLGTNKAVEFGLPSNTHPNLLGKSRPPIDADLSISVENVGRYLDTNTLQVKSHPLHDYVNGKINTINSLSIGSGSSSGISLKYVKDNPATVAGYIS